MSRRWRTVPYVSLSVTDYESVVVIFISLRGNAALKGGPIIIGLLFNIVCSNQYHDTEDQTDQCGSQVGDRNILHKIINEAAGSNHYRQD